MVREIAAEGRLRTGTADLAAQALWASCHGVVALMINRPNLGWAPTDELIEVTLDGLMYGLVADSDSARNPLGIRGSGACDAAHRQRPGRRGSQRPGIGSIAAALQVRGVGVIGAEPPRQARAR